MGLFESVKDMFGIMDDLSDYEDKFDRIDAELQEGIKYMAKAQKVFMRGLRKIDDQMTEYKNSSRKVSAKVGDQAIKVLGFTIIGRLPFIGFHKSLKRCLARCKEAIKFTTEAQGKICAYPGSAEFKQKLIEKQKDYEVLQKKFLAISAKVTPLAKQITAITVIKPILRDVAMGFGVGVVKCFPGCKFLGELIWRAHETMQSHTAKKQTKKFITKNKKLLKGLVYALDELVVYKKEVEGVLVRIKNKSKRVVSDIKRLSGKNLTNEEMHKEFKKTIDTKDFLNLSVILEKALQRLRRIFQTLSKKDFKDKAKYLARLKLHISQIVAFTKQCDKLTAELSNVGASGVT